jgi:DNA-binding transcriptional MerR regulator
MTETHHRLPSEVATSLQVSPSTLRRWSNEFADYLTDTAGRPEAAGSGGTAHRRYSDEDLETLMTIKGLLAEGLTYIQVGRRLEALRVRQAAGDEQGARSITVLEPSYQEASYSPAVAVLADTLHTVADGQQLLLGSQQANRDLQTVLVQDNFTLKEENAKLRNRMLELERDLSELRRLDTARRDALDARLDKLEARLSRKKAKTEESERPGCLSRFFGG